LDVYSKESMQKTIRWFGFIILPGLLLAFPTPRALAAAYQLHVSGNRLSADFQNTPFSAVIADIAAKTGIQFIFLGGAAGEAYSHPFSFRVNSVPIRAALEKLLSDFNCSIISDGNDTVRQVFILGPKSAAGTGVKTRTPFVVAANAGAVPGEERDASLSSEGMQVVSGGGMQITPGEGMQIGPGGGMQITPGKGMQIGPPGEKGMEIGPGEGMIIGSPGEGGPPEGVQIVSPGDQGAQERVVSPEGGGTKPGPPVRRPSRWSIRKK